MHSPTQTRHILLLLLLSAGAVLVEGYHLGIEDQATYLPAIKLSLHPNLYPHDAAFFLAQTRWTQLPELVAFTVRWTHLPLDWAVFLWFLASVFLLLLGCWKVGRRCFTGPAGQWGSVALVAALFSIPVAGTLLILFAQYLHPRGLATPLVLFGLLAVLDESLMAFVWIVLAGVIHPQIAFYGAIFLLFQAWRAPRRKSSAALACIAVAIPGWAPSNRAWQEVLAERNDWLIFRWHWYEWLGVVAPLGLLWLFAWIGRRQGMPLVEHISRRTALAGIVTGCAGIAIVALPQLQRFVPIQPMRILLFVYLMLFLIGGGLLGQFLLRNRVWRWLVIFLLLAGGMVYSQRQQFPGSPHIEWPGAATRTAWLQAFDWVRQNTPRDALFALDPRYMERPGEDSHGFRALAERSMLADYTKDRGVAALFPELAETWRQHVRARENWASFTRGDFLHLKQKYGVTWVVLERSGVNGLPCPYANERVMVCRVE